MIIRNRIYARGKNHVMYRHGQTVNGASRLYAVWHHMIARCEYPNDINYKNYGGRGILVCKEWHDSKIFIEWATNNGYKDDLTIDRINNNGNYEPNNCRFITFAENHKNRRKRPDWGVYRTKWGSFEVTVGKRINGYDHLFYGGHFQSKELALKRRDELYLELNPL